jgi:hypothetical protein
VEERQTKAVAVSADDGLDPAHLGFDTNDWEFTMRTGVSLSNPASRSHSRSNSYISASGLEASSSSSTQGGKAAPGQGQGPSQGQGQGQAQGQGVQRGVSRSASLSRGQARGDPSLPVRQPSNRREDVFRTSSSDTENSADDGHSDEGSPTRNGSRGPHGSTSSPAPQPATTTTSTVTAASTDYEGISFPTSYPNKARSPLVALGSKSSGSPVASPRAVQGAPPRPKSISLADGEGSRGTAALEERLANLQQEVRALSRENSLISNITAPYLRALELVYQQQQLAALAAAQPGAASTPAGPPPSLSSAIQQAVYAEDGREAEELTSQVAALGKLSSQGRSAAYRGVVLPALNQLHCRVASALKPPAQSASSGRSGGLRRHSQTPAQRSAEQAGDVLRVLAVAMVGLDAFEATNPLQKQLAQRQHAAANKTQRVVMSVPEAIDLSAPTPKATHGARAAVAAVAAAVGGGQEDPALQALEQGVVAPLPGLGSLDLLTLLTAYLEEDMRQAGPGEGGMINSPRK